MSQDLMEIIQVIIDLKNKGWSLYNKPWWICRVGTHWTALDCWNDEIVHFDSLRVQHVSKGI